MTAAPMARLPETARATLFALSAGNFMVGIAAFVVLGLMSTIARDLAIEPAEGARLMIYYAIAYAIGSPLLIATTGRLPRRLVIAGAILLVGIGSLACGLAPTLDGMKVARVMTALGAGLFSPATAAVAVSLVSPERRGWALSQVFMGFTAAQGIGNPIGAWFGYTFGWRSAFLAVGALSVLMSALMWRLVPADTPFRPTTLRELGAILKTPHLLIALLFTVCFVGATYTTLTYITLILESRLGLGGTGVAIVLAIYGCMAFLAAVLSGPATDRFGPSRVLLTLCLLLVVLMPLVTQGSAHPILLTFNIGAWSLCSWFHFTAQQTRLVSISPPLAQLMLALNASMLYVGIAIGSVLAAQLLPIPDFVGLATGAVVQLVLAGIVLVVGDRVVARHLAAPKATIDPRPL
jgi:MFS transporter, DHA1 family, inner membrane transport protein